MQTENTSIVESKPSQKQEAAVAERPQSPQVIMGDDSIERATIISDKLSKIIDQQKLYADIQGKKYVTVEGWTTLGAIMSVFPEVVKLERVPATDDREVKYIAEVRLKALNGTVVSAAQSICSNRERSKTHSDEYVISSMAQTRATGKAFRLAFSWIMKMAGYEPCAAEEIEQESYSRITPKQVKAEVIPPTSARHIDELKKYLGQIPSVKRGRTPKERETNAILFLVEQGFGVVSKFSDITPEKAREIHIALLAKANELKGENDENVVQV